MPRSGEPAALGAAIRRSVIEESRRANVGHIGSALSVADLVAVLFAGRLELDGDDRDRFVLSKGHAALALYAALEATGRLAAGELQTFCGDGTLLGVHPEAELDGIDFSTGSLGQGVSVAAGAALGARLQGSPRRTYVLLSDAELNEGNVWEAIMFAAHHRLDRLTAIVDLNGQQALGYTEDVLDLGAVEEKLAAFGWHVQVADGHDHDALARALDEADAETDRPSAIIARTTFGKGVSFMESRIEWHYLPLSAEQHEQALGELGAVA
jgi:transketolase